MKGRGSGKPMNIYIYIFLSLYMIYIYTHLTIYTSLPTYFLEYPRVVASRRTTNFSRLANEVATNLAE